MSVVRAGLIILFVLLVGVINAFISTGSTSSNAVGTCTNSGAGNATNFQQNCGAGTSTGFIGTIFSTSVTGFSGAPAIINAIWITAAVFLLTVAVIDIVRLFIPLLPGSG